MSDRPDPAYRTGQLVRVALNERNRTPHAGRIRDVVWHHKDQQFNFYIEENGKKVPKRYLAEDLEPVPETASDHP